MNQSISYRSDKTREFLFDLKPDLQSPVSFQRAQKIAKQLGCNVLGENRARFLFWHPDLRTANLTTIELFIPNLYLNFEKPQQHASFHYYSFPIQTEGEFAAAVIDGIPIGHSEQFGAFYQLKVQYSSGRESIIRDPLADSLPYGIHAPAEVYDIESALSNRSDTGYYTRLNESLENTDERRISPAVNLLEIHVQTATKTGTLHSLTHRLNQIKSKINSGTELTPDEQNLVEFEAFELMPLDPVIEHPGHHTFWDPIHTPAENGEEVTVRLNKPKVLNWGYDITIFGAASVNPSLLSSGRPDELVRFIEAAHSFPKPIKVVLDVVYGHADNQALDLLHDIFFTGPNMYGQDIRFRHPLVRAIILEMQRRKINYGFDGVRVDGSQDFKYYDEVKEKLLHDDQFLLEMSNVTQNVAEVSYKPWMIFEDGRPWPRDDWELASTYRDVTDNQPWAFQWAPMIFAYNTPYTYTYWVSKWWRLKEQLHFGEKWITGYANHDTMRRGSQTDPSGLNINTHLGNSLKMVMENAYNNPATTLLMHGFLPGVPMDFLQSLGSTPWSFVRDTDTDYAIKVAAEESHFLDWQVSENEYRQARFFKRLKNMGFETLSQLRQFSKSLLRIVEATEYEPDCIPDMLNHSTIDVLTGEWTIDLLNEYSFAWMRDINEYSNVDHHAQYVSRKKSDFNLVTRSYRRNNPWLCKNFCSDDSLFYKEPANGTIIYYGRRSDPENGKEIFFVANMEGQSRQITPAELGLEVGDVFNWRVALCTPNITQKEIHEPVRLSVGQGLLYEKG